MKFSEFIIKDAITPSLAAQSREEAIAELISALAAAGAVPAADVEELTAAVIKREKGGSTGLGKGVAVPHVKHPKVQKMIGTVGRSEGGIDFSSLDNQPVYSVFLVLSPESQPQQHLQAMNIIVTNLQKEMFRKFLRQSTTRNAIAELLDEADQGK